MRRKERVSEMSEGWRRRILPSSLLGVGSDLTTATRHIHTQTVLDVVWFSPETEKANGDVCGVQRLLDNENM